MNKKPLRAFSLFCLVGLLLPASGAAQCKDQLCRNLQNTLDAAVTDFREYRANRIAVPDVSVAGAKVPCQMTAWANNVPMLMCYAQIPYQAAQLWPQACCSLCGFCSPLGNSKWTPRPRIIL